MPGGALKPRPTKGGCEVNDCRRGRLRNSGLHVVEEPAYHRQCSPSSPALLARGAKRVCGDAAVDRDERAVRNQATRNAVCSAHKQQAPRDKGPGIYELRLVTLLCGWPSGA